MLEITADDRCVSRQGQVKMWFGGNGSSVGTVNRGYGRDPKSQGVGEAEVKSIGKGILHHVA